MTSMLRTSSSAAVAGAGERAASFIQVAIALKEGEGRSCGLPSRVVRLRRLAAIDRRDVLVLGVFGRGLLDHRAEELLVGLNPLGREAPLFAVALLDARLVHPRVVAARDRDRPRQAFEAELLQAIGGHLQILEAPADLLAGHRLVAESRHRRADRFRAEHRADWAAGVPNLPHPPPPCPA